MSRSLNERIIEATRKSLEGKIELHKVNLEIMLYNQVGVAEHPDTLETIEKELAIIAEYHDQIEMLEKYFDATIYV